ncbi:hypothetical protein [Streptomyces panaciradicis]|uniref:hypothetical protein n=1 Tax=Streptomyces panaciradicis TaxID=1470261 RepID=UPI00201CBA1E|nr:hypothetical protein [Streptomyces panaciradicis]MCL6667522.1 hypothetical protein [Streptomyces panaciradicis]
MTRAIRVEVLPARLGDCLLVECARPGRAPWRMLVDGGPPDTWPTLEGRLKRLDPTRRCIDLAVVTHVDGDHSGGMIPFLGSSYADDLGDCWFNGRSHLPGPLPLPGLVRSVSQGDSITTELEGQGTGRVLPWNMAFGGGPIDTGSAAGFIEVAIPGGPCLTVLSPTTKRLAVLGTVWSRSLADARRGRSSAIMPDVPEPLEDLATLAAECTPKDSSPTNGSSVALLVEHRGASVVLAADAFDTVLGAGLTGVAAARGLAVLPVDAFKLPHHASKCNVSEAMLKVAPARHYLVSTNGDTFHHPDDVALARVVLTAPTGSTLWFNYQTSRTERWADPTLCAGYGYTARFPEDPKVGTVLELPARP